MSKAQTIAEVGAESAGDFGPASAGVAPDGVASDASVVASAQASPVVKTFGELSAAEHYGLLQLRSRVFVVEQNCVFLDLDGVDTLPETLHYFFPAPAKSMRDTHGSERGLSLEPFAYARLLPPDFPDGPAHEPGARSISRVVSDPSIRGGGWGRRIISAIVSDHDHELLTLNAQSYLEDFYASFGFRVNGAAFVEDGIPHVPMSRQPGGR